MGEGGLAAAMAGPSMMYGNGEGNTTQHAYGGAMNTPKQRRQDKGPGTPKDKKCKVKIKTKKGK